MLAKGFKAPDEKEVLGHALYEFLSQESKKNFGHSLLDNYANTSPALRRTFRDTAGQFKDWLERREQNASEEG